MAARRTRAAARRAALVPFLSELSDDEIEAIGYVLADPLAPRLAVALSSCSRGLRRALAAPLKELKERRQKERSRVLTAQRLRRSAAVPHAPPTLSAPFYCCAAICRYVCGQLTTPWRRRT